MLGQLAKHMQVPVNSGEQRTATCAAVADPEDPIREAVAQGKPDAAIELCAARFGGSIGRLCMALLGSQAEAEDVVQETLVTAHGSLAQWRGEGSLRAWLFGIARRKCARQLERKSAHALKLQLVTPPASPDDDAEQRLLANERARKARLALAAVKPSEREALVLRYVGELSFKEIAEACGIDEAAARKRVSRALHKLRASVRHEESEP